MSLECGHCIQERCTEGKWDRFGYTAQEELEATCMRHLIELEKSCRTFHGKEEADLVAAEIEKRNES